MKSQTRLRALLIISSVAVLSSESLAEASSYDVKSDDSSVEFTAVGKPGFLRINGHGAKVTGSATASGTNLEGKFTVKLDDLATGISLRDEHMKTKYLETGKYPYATLSMILPTAKVVETGETVLKGKLTLHGVEKDVSISAKLSPSSDQKSVEVDATFQIELSTFKIDIPSYLGVTVAEDVETHVHFVATAKP